MQGRVLRALAGLDPRSPPELAWVLKSTNVAALAAADGYDAGELLAFRERMVGRLLA